MMATSDSCTHTQRYSPHTWESFHPSSMRDSLTKGPYKVWPWLGAEPKKKLGPWGPGEAGSSSTGTFLPYPPTKAATGAFSLPLFFPCLEPSFLQAVSWRGWPFLNGCFPLNLIKPVHESHYPLRDKEEQDRMHTRTCEYTHDHQVWWE